MKGVHKIPFPVHEASNFAFHFRDPETKSSRRDIGGGPTFIAPSLSRLVGQLGKPRAGICVAENGLDRSGVARTGLADAYVGRTRHWLRLAGRRRSATGRSAPWLFCRKRTPRVPLILKSLGGCSVPEWKGLSRTASGGRVAATRSVVLERPFHSGDRLAVRFKDGPLRREGRRGRRGSSVWCVRFEGRASSWRGGRAHCREAQSHLKVGSWPRLDPHRSITPRAIRRRLISTLTRRPFTRPKDPVAQAGRWPPFFRLSRQELAFWNWVAGPVETAKPCWLGVSSSTQQTAFRRSPAKLKSG